MSLIPGTCLGHYEVTAQIGVGGMGEVYRATDTKLKRQVAIKVLPESLASDPERLARFQREAEVLASLNHPNIAAIYGLEDAAPSPAGSGGPSALKALVMELVEGPTLADRIADGAISVAEALPIAKQIAEALEAAHEQGIIHRDLKPANVKVRPDGTVKVLDFGLAKALEPASALRASAGQTQSMAPTITTPAMMTGVGMVLGTAAYMSPEQAKGRPADKRSDVWAFGAVLFEMLTGKRPFEGEDVSDVMGAVLRLEPSWALLTSDVPLAVQSLLRGCLVKERRHRVGDIAAALFVLGQAENLATAGAARADALSPALLWLRALPWAVAAAAVVGLAAWIAMAPGPSPPGPGGRFVLSAPPSAPLAAANVAEDLAISPDGAWVVYTSGSPAQLYLRAIDGLEGSLLRGTDGAAHPFFSPDGNWIGFNTEASLRKVSLVGGPAQTLSSAVGGFRGASWESDDTIVVATTAGLFRVPAAGGDPTPLLPQGEGDAVARFFPDVLPGGRALLGTRIGGTLARMVFLLDLETLEERILFPGQAPRYSPTGHILYVVDGTLMAVSFDLGRLEVTGAPVPMVEGVMTKPSGAADFDFASNGSLVYASGSGLGQDVVWVERDGRTTPIPGVPRNTYRDVRVSPDGARVAIATLDDVWTYDIERATLGRLTTDPANERSPLWSPDGARIVFTSDRGGFPELFWRPADGTGTAERLLARADTLIDLRAHDWSPDGFHLLFSEVTAQIGCHVGQVAVSDGSEVAGPDRNTFCDDYAAVSPDGRWVAYSSDLSGRAEIYVGRYPDLGGRQQVSSAGGNLPRWRADGSELFFGGLDARQMLHVSVQLGNAPGSALVVGRPEVLFEQAHLPVATGWRPYDVSPDGRFVMLTSGDGTDAGAAPNVILVQNWHEELKRLVPTP